MSIILPNLNHSFISLVPVPVPDSGSGSGSGFPGFPYAPPLDSLFLEDFWVDEGFVYKRSSPFTILFQEKLRKRAIKK